MLTRLLFAVLVMGAYQTPAAAECTSGATTLAGVPAIVRAPASITKPPILLWHGFGPPASEAALMEALPLDDVPAVKVYLGLPLFGARAPSSEAESVAKRQSEDYGLRLFEPVVLGAAKELKAVVGALRKAKCMGRTDPVGLFGFSAGGAAALIALEERDVRISAAITVNAPVGLATSIDALERATKRPYSWTPASRQLADRTDAIRRAQDIATGAPPPALLLFHGADDTVVTPKGAESLQAALRPYYERAHTADRLKLTLAPNVSHKWTEPETLQTLRATISDWYNRYL